MDAVINSLAEVSSTLDALAKESGGTEEGRATLVKSLSTTVECAMEMARAIPPPIGSAPGKTEPAAAATAAPAVSTPASGEPPATADIMDAYEGKVQVAPNIFQDFGGVSRFCGRVETVKCFENNPLVRLRLTGEDGTGKVLVVDGGGSTRRALMGDQLGAAAVKNCWTGVIINGAIRDSAEIAKLPLGCKALGTIPLKSEKKNTGEQGVSVSFAGLRFREGQFVYADEDGIVVSDTPLVVPRPAL